MESIKLRTFRFSKTGYWPQRTEAAFTFHKVVSFEFHLFLDPPSYPQEANLEEGIRKA